MKLVAASLAMFCFHSVAHAASNDTATCVLPDGVITVAFDAQSSKVTAIESAKGKPSESQEGVSYQLMTSTEALADETVSGLAQYLAIQNEEVITAAVFVLSKNDDGAMATVKFTLKDNKTKTALVAGMTVVKCL